MKRYFLICLPLLLCLGGCTNKDVSAGDIVPKGTNNSTNSVSTEDSVDAIASDELADVVATSESGSTTESATTTDSSATTESLQEEQLLTIQSDENTASIFIPADMVLLSKSESSVVVQKDALYTFSFSDIYKVVDDASAESELKEWFITGRSVEADAEKSIEFSKASSAGVDMMYSLWIPSSGDSANAAFAIKASSGSYVIVKVSGFTYSLDCIDKLAAVVAQSVQ